jgi:hypothetical protein
MKQHNAHGPHVGPPLFPPHAVRPKAASAAMRVGVSLLVAFVMGLTPGVAVWGAAIVDDDVVLAARRVRAWTEPLEDGPSRQWLLLDDDVRIEIGAYGFRADRAVARVDRDAAPGVDGRPTEQVMLWLEGARPLRGRSAVWAEASRLLVTAATRGEIRLQTDLLDPRPAADHALVQQARARFEAHLTGEVLIDALLAEGPARPGQVLPLEPDAPPHLPVVRPPVEPIDRVLRLDADQRVLPVDATISFGAQRVIYQGVGDDRPQPSLLLIGDVRLLLEQRTRGDDAIGGGRSMSLAAGSAVILLRDEADPPVLEAGAARVLESGRIAGIYLEDNVIATDGEFTVRAPRVYYDVALDRALLLEAVLFTYDVERQVPLYLRAAELHQEARRRWEARDARLTTSAFAEPHVAIGASRLTIEQPRRDDEGDDAPVRFSARHTTTRVGDVPVLYWPAMSGKVDQAIPLTKLEVGHDRRDGVQVRTSWDVFALADHEPPASVTMEGHVDYLGRRGPGLGLDMDYQRPTLLGRFRGYGLFHDQGKDDVGRRMRVEPDDSLRGYVRWQHRQYVLAGWELSLEGAYVSDPMFLEHFESREAYTAKPYETSLYLKRQNDDWAMTLLASSQLNNFSPQLTTLQTPGYDVEKLPELSYYRVGTDLLGQRLTYYSETRASRMRILAGRDAPIDRGFTSAQSLELFGIAANTTSFDANFDAMGVPDDAVMRIDSRHELQAPMQWGHLNVVPYLTGRVTAYDDNFSDYDPDAEHVRLWGSGGVRLHTAFARLYPDLNIAALDVHQLRHVIEPEVDLFYAGSTVDSAAYPVYDADVESIAEGWGVRLGVRQTLQTRRGGIGRWRNVDWIVFHNELVLRGRDADVDADVPRHFAYRPEYGRGGNHIHSELMWLVTDALALVGEATYGLEDQHMERWRVGATMEHTRQLSSFVTYSQITDLQSRLLAYGFKYRISPKYALSLRHTLDLDGSELSRELDVTLERRLPQFLLLISAGFDQIDDTQSLLVRLRPLGLAGRPMLEPGPLAFD